MRERSEESRNAQGQLREAISKFHPHITFSLLRGEIIRGLLMTWIRGVACQGR